MKRSVYVAMIEHCKRCLPNEGCGLLSGTEEAGDSLWPIENEAHHPNRFYMSASAIEEAVEKMKKKGEQLTAIFHSHPSTPAVPSSHDIANNPYTELAYLIVSFHNNDVDVACFMMNEQGVFERDIILINDA